MQFADVANDSALDQVTAIKSGLVREFIRLWLLARYRVSRGARPWLGITTALATVLVAVFLHFHILRPFLWKSGEVFAALPLTSELIRLPMSFFLPTAYLPLWAACLQLVVVIGLSEMILGRWLTIVVALVGHFGSTLVARRTPRVGPQSLLRNNARAGARPRYGTVRGDHGGRCVSVGRHQTEPLRTAAQYRSHRRGDHHTRCRRSRAHHRTRHRNGGGPGRLRRRLSLQRDPRRFEEGTLERATQSSGARHYFDASSLRPDCSRARTRVDDRRLVRVRRPRIGNPRTYGFALDAL